MHWLNRWRAPSTAEILRELLGELHDLRRSDRHVDALREDLGKFAARFPRLRKVRSCEIVLYLRGLSRNVGPRRRDNIRNAIVQLFRFARRNEYLEEGRLTEAEKIRQIKPGHEIVTWSPAETRLLLNYCEPRWIPCEVLGLFAGLRRSEIFRLDWEAFRWEPEPVITVKRSIAKKIKNDRHVPIQPNLLKWLEPHRGRPGPLYSTSFKRTENAHSMAMFFLRQRTGLQRKDNANRHSFGSYRLAVLNDYAKVAHEMGNSERKVRENYNDPKTRHEAADYFSIVPPDYANVVPMPLALEFR